MCVEPTLWTLRVSFERNVSRFALHKALKSIARSKVTFDERAVLYHVAGFFRAAL